MIMITGTPGAGSGAGEGGLTLAEDIEAVIDGCKRKTEVCVGGVKYGWV